MPLYDFLCAEGHRFERHVKLADFEAVQACECGEDAHRQISAPRILSDYIEPCRGADGKMYDSLRGLRATYLPSGNPQGERYLELGDQEITPTVKTFDRKQRREDIKAAIEDVKNGRVPPIPPGPPAQPGLLP
jgi:putative FmdB family regulatory protein